MTDTPRPSIEERENGPLVVKNITSLQGEDGTMLDCKPVMALCRCGGSSTKPFCDGTHQKNGFQSRGGEPAGKDKILTYEGAEVTVTYNPRLCSHAAECGRIAGQIFNPEQKPWIQPDNGKVAEVEAVIAACPSGALAIGERQHKTADVAEIRVEKNGSYWVCGPTLDAHEPGEGATPRKYVLCRCGMSGNKPYCDGSHRDKGWKSD